MQEIEYEDGRKTKKLFASFEKALEDATEANEKRPIKSLKVTRIIPSKRRK